MRAGTPPGRSGVSGRRSGRTHTTPEPTSIGAAAVPGAGLIMLVIVLGAIGIDPQGLALIIAIDRPLDMCRTIVNVTGDATVASVVASTEGEKIKYVNNE